jgi:gliding motility-associated-like protein
MKHLGIAVFFIFLKINFLTAQTTRMTVCEGDSVALNTALVGLDYSWSPATDLSNPRIRIPFAKPLQSTTYVSTVFSLQQNILSNSDFSQGNVGFTSDYPVSTNANFGHYFVTNRGAQSWWNGFSACTDHTSGSGNMMLVDGGSSSNEKIWCQQVAVQPNTSYAFSAWIQNICTCGAPPRLQFAINGVGLGNIINVTTVNCQWNQFYEIWNSGVNTSAKICLLNENTNPNGNDFALDDITFTPVTPSHDTFIVNVIPKTLTPLNTTICKGDSLFFNNRFYKIAGTYDKILKTTKNCDSTVRMNLTIRTPAYEIVRFDSICKGNSYFFAGNTYNTEGSYSNCFRSSTGGDSIVTVHLGFFPSYSINRKDTICFGDSLLVGQKYFKNTGNYAVKLTSKNGCDSLINLSLFVRPQNIRTQKVYICHVDFYQIGDSVYNKTGIYRNILRGLNCDSTVITDLEVFIKWTEKIDTLICANKKLTVNNKIYTQTGHFRDTIFRPFNCDTIFDIHLRVMSLPFMVQNVSLCKGESFKINNKTYTQTGSYTDTISLKNNCDSIIVTNINVIDLTLNLVDYLTVKNGDSITLKPTINSTNNLAWQWSPPTGLSCTNCQTPTLTPLSNQGYKVLVKDTKFGCTATRDVFVKVNPCDKVFIPNSFSPNDDKVNDVFIPYGSTCAKGIKKMQIYNRWGDLVFSVENATFGNETQGWNGKFNGKNLPADVYVYVVIIEFGNGTTEVYSGDISLIN